jgi:endonuclease/exonuclease/phosphatase family metal-dependent hydrolase
LVQEVDKKARRSYQVDQFEILSKSLNTHKGLFAANYNVFFVPIPLHNPMGNVLAGLATFSEFDPFSAVRHSFPGNYSWPTRLFMLDRCFLVNRYPLSNGRQLLIINTHNSAFDDGSLRKQQMAHLKSFLLAEYKKKNYLIVGGDWNQEPFDFSPDFETNAGGKDNISVEEGFPDEDWIWVYDKRTPSHRGLQAPYDEESSRLTVIDFYLVSPNVIPSRVRTIDMDFEFSDHQPVVASFELLPEHVEPIN